MKEDEIKTDELIPGEEMDEFDQQMAGIWGGSQTIGIPILRFKEGKMVVKMGDAEKEYEEINGVRLIFYAQKYDLIRSDGKGLGETIAYSSEYYTNQSHAGYLFMKKAEDQDKGLRIKLDKLSDVKNYITKLMQEDKELKKTYYEILYLDTPDGIMKMYLKYTQSAGVQITGKGKDLIVKTLFDDPLEGSYRYIKKVHPFDVHKYVYDLVPLVYSPGKNLSEVTFPAFINEKREIDSELPQKVREIIEIIKTSEQEKNDKSTIMVVDEEEEFDTPKLEEQKQALKNRKKVADEDLPF